jgi:N-ethylmaleimide reductase
MHDRPYLLSPVKLRLYILPNQVVMAPMTRGRGGEENAPHSMNAIYDAQRASAGLLIRYPRH